MSFGSSLLESILILHIRDQKEIYCQFSKVKAELIKAKKESKDPLKVTSMELILEALWDKMDGRYKRHRW